MSGSTIIIRMKTNHFCVFMYFEPYYRVFRINKWFGVFENIICMMHDACLTGRLMRNHIRNGAHGMKWNHGAENGKMFATYVRCCFFVDLLLFYISCALLLFVAWALEICIFCYYSFISPNPHHLKEFELSSYRIYICI